MQEGTDDCGNVPVRKRPGVARAGRFCAVGVSLRITRMARAWATVNKLDGGGKKNGSGRKKAK